MQFKDADKLDMNLWYDINKSKIYKDTEGFKSVVERIGQFLEEIKTKYPEKNVLLVTHGDICKAIYTYLNGLSNSKEISSFEQKNCEIKRYIY